MLKRHESELATRLDALNKFGWTHIKWWEIYLWYDVEKISKKPWRDLRDRFEEENSGDLYIYKDEAGVLLIQSDGLTTVAKELGEDTDDE